MADPRNLKSVDEISFRTGYIIIPILALEVRLVFALEKHYGIKRTMRYIAPPKQVREELNQLHVFNTPDGPVLESNTDEDLGTPGSEHVYEKAPAAPIKSQQVAATEGIEEGIEELDDDDLIEELEDEEITLATTAQSLVKITDRNDVADAVSLDLFQPFHTITQHHHPLIGCDGILTILKAV